MAAVTANQRLVDVLAATRPVLLDFDGPVTHLFVNGRNRMVADRMREAIPKDFQPPPDVWDTYDPLIVLRWAASNTPISVQEAVDAASVEGEVDAAHQTEPTPGSADLLRACKQVGRPVVIVSNNAEQAIRTYLERFDLLDLVTAVVARAPGRPDLMKPHPDSINRALALLDAVPDVCCMVGDSVSDVEVCKATGVRSIGFAKTPTRGQELVAAGAAAVTDSMFELSAAIARTNSKTPPTQVSTPDEATLPASAQPADQKAHPRQTREDGRHSWRRILTWMPSIILAGIFLFGVGLSLVSQINVQGRHTAIDAFTSNRGAGGPGDSVRLTPRYPAEGTDYEGMVKLDIALQDLDVTGGVIGGTVTAYLDHEKFKEEYPNEPVPMMTTISVTGYFSIRSYEVPLGNIYDKATGRAAPIYFEVWGESRAFPFDAYGSNNFVELTDGSLGRPTVQVEVGPGLSEYSAKAAISSSTYKNFLLTRHLTQSLWVTTLGLSPAILLVAVVLASTGRFATPTRVEAIGVGAGFLAILPLREVLVPDTIHTLTRLDYLLGVELLAFLCVLAYLYLRDSQNRVETSN